MASSQLRSHWGHNRSVLTTLSRLTEVAGRKGLSCSVWVPRFRRMQMPPPPGSHTCGEAWRFVGCTRFCSGSIPTRWNLSRTASCSCSWCPSSWLLTARRHSGPAVRMLLYINTTFLLTVESVVFGVDHGRVWKLQAGSVGWAEPGEMDAPQEHPLLRRDQHLGTTR